MKKVPEICINLARSPGEGVRDGKNNKKRKKSFDHCGKIYVYNQNENFQKLRQNAFYSKSSSHNAHTEQTCISSLSKEIENIDDNGLELLVQLSKIQIEKRKKTQEGFLKTEQLNQKPIKKDVKKVSNKDDFEKLKKETKACESVKSPSTNKNINKSQNANSFYDPCHCDFPHQSHRSYDACNHHLANGCEHYQTSETGCYNCCHGFAEASLGGFDGYATVDTEASCCLPYTPLTPTHHIGDLVRNVTTKEFEEVSEGDGWLMNRGVVTNVNPVCARAPRDHSCLNNPLPEQAVFPQCPHSHHPLLSQVSEKIQCNAHHCDLHNQTFYIYCNQNLYSVFVKRIEPTYTECLDSSAYALEDFEEQSDINVCNENRTDHFIESMYTFLDHVNNLENFDKNKMTMNQFCRPKEYCESYTGFENRSNGNSCYFKDQQADMETPRGFDQKGQCPCVLSPTRNPCWETQKKIIHRLKKMCL